VAYDLCDDAISAPQLWDPKSHGYVGTDRMRVQDDVKRFGSPKR
jgi:hypothetical protein